MLSKLVYRLIGTFVYNYFYKGPDYIDFDDFKLRVWDDYIIKLILLYGMAFTILVPTCLIDNIGKMRFAAIVSVIALVYVIVVSLL